MSYYQITWQVFNKIHKTKICKIIKFIKIFKYIYLYVVYIKRNIYIYICMCEREICGLKGLSNLPEKDPCLQVSLCVSKLVGFLLASAAMKR